MSTENEKLVLLLQRMGANATDAIAAAEILANDNYTATNRTFEQHELMRKVSEQIANHQSNK
jgi:hypothetical protein